MVLFVYLAVFWILLSGYFATLPLIPGLASFFIIIFLYKRAVRFSPRHIEFLLSVAGFLAYLPYLFRDIILSNIHVAKDILTNKVNPQIIEIANDFKYNSAAVCYTASVILTPGSIVLDENEQRFLVHVLDHDVGVDILSKSLVKRIQKMTKEK